jgi:hypothetical protein
MTDAVVARETTDPAKFEDGISIIIDGIVMWLNASTWRKQTSASSTQPTV